MTVLFLSPFERLLAFRYLRARKAEGFVSVIAGFSFLGIMLGVATLIIVMAVMNGFRAELTGRMMGLNGHLSVYTAGDVIKNPDPLLDNIRQVNGIDHLLPFIEAQGLLQHKGTASGVMVRGYDPADFAWKPIISASIIQGETADLTSHAVFIGKDLADRLGLTRGDPIRLIAPSGQNTPFGVMPRSYTYRVGGVFDVGMYEYNNNFLFMAMPQARLFGGLTNQAVTGIEVHLSDPDRLHPIQKIIQDRLGSGQVIYNWQESNAAFFNALQVERNVMFLILTLIILVAAFNIISSMMMLVKDKTRDIAILRTMGATQRNIITIFMTTGASIGLFGTMIGAFAGISFALNIDSIRQGIEAISGTELFAAEIYFLTHLPAKIDWSEVLTVVIMACVLSILSTLYPALRAAKLDPVEALRYE